MDLILRHAHVAGREAEGVLDIGIAAGRIAVIAPDLAAEGPQIELAGRLVAPGFVETHIHLDKSRILARCASDRGTLEEAIEEVARAKLGFTAEDVHARGAKTLERAILNGTTHMRTHLEVDPGIGLRGFEGILPLVREYAWAIDLEICIFPQEGLLNNPGTDALMMQALAAGTPWDLASRRAHEVLGHPMAGNGSLMRCAPVALRFFHDPDGTNTAAGSPSAMSPNSPPPIRRSSPPQPGAWPMPGWR